MKEGLILHAIFTLLIYSDVGTRKTKENSRDHKGSVAKEVKAGSWEILNKLHHKKVVGR